MSAVEIRLHGERVGQLAHRSDFGDATEFRIDASWRDQPASSRAVLGQIFEDDPDREWRTTHRVPAWFSNLLPEGLLRKLLAEQAGVNPVRELHLLAALGCDLPGAVTAHALDEIAEVPLRPPRPPVEAEETLRFSLAGLQLKFSVHLDDRGPTLPVRGQGGRWLAKLPDPRFNAVPENEFAMLGWAAAAGIEVPEHALYDTQELEGLPFAGEESIRQGLMLLVKRFDRLPDGRSVHIEDLAQVRNVFAESKYEKASYETIGRVLYTLCGEDDLKQYIRRLVFMVISGNADMHLKNWSLWYPDGQRARLAPAYDPVATLAWPGTSQRLALNLGKTKSFLEIDLDTFGRLAEKAGWERELGRAVASEARDQVRDTWNVARDRLPDDQRARLEDHQNTLRL
jgi:serine/threonine-protein kinase HipA